jgi:SAM-dependent methyltransferase
MLYTILKETLKGKSLCRTLENLALSSVTLSGSGIDLGCGAKKSSCYRFLKQKPGTKILLTDLYPASEGVLKLDLEKPFPLPDDSQDFLLLNNVLEHLYDYQTCVQQCFRVLKKDAVLSGVVPFLHCIHPDPDDHFRYTESTLKRLFTEAGFQTVKIQALGFGPFSSSAAQWALLSPLKSLTAAFYLLGIGLDRSLNKLFKKNSALRIEQYPLAYFFVCQK